MNVCQFIPDELRKKFSELIKENTKSLDTHIELEARFGYFADNNFNSKLIDNSLFFNLKKHLDDLYNKNKTSILRIETRKIVNNGSLNIRKIQELPGRLYYQKKISDWSYDNKDWGIRFCRSYETEISDTKVINFISTFRRDVNRTTYIDNRHNSQFFGFKIEISKVYSKGETNYEVELESLHGAILTIDKWWGALKTLYGWSLNAQDNKQIISLKERIMISLSLNELLSNCSNHNILPSIVNRPKTLTNLKDIRNKAVSVKIDGFHKILYFCNTGVYSCSPSLNITKISDINTKTFTVVECEYIPSTNQFFGFDVLIHKNNDVRCCSFEKRYNLLCNFLNQINIEFIIFKKWYFPGNQYDIFQLINNKISLLNSKCSVEGGDLLLPVDGLIFQSLGNYDEDIYKWKSPENLTIDFYLQLGINDIYEVYVFKSKLLYKVDIKISGKSTLPGELHKKIVECKWVPEQNYWEPVKIRDDKLNPNSYEVVQSTIKLLKNPITLDNIICNL